ncbi:pleiotropic drug resistance protein 1-like protein [Tanacetum coccineum]|uniref:Pleiotropic drug resistance protein 1-like protein n=1 Tax=Tanacetum coccineum TaxID=301880 RepID=A0ABQ5JDM4_9ASTR
MKLELSSKKARLVAQGYNQQKGIDYDGTFASIARLKAIRIFLAFATYINFIGFESSEFPNHVFKLDKVVYELKQSPRACSSVKTIKVPPNMLGPDLNGKAVNETHYRGMIGSLMYLTTSRPDIQFLTCLCARYQANPKESQLIVVKRIFIYLKGTPSLGLWYPKCLGFDQKGYSDSDYDIIYEKVPNFVITLVLLKSQTIQFCTKEQSILISNITLSEIIFSKGNLNYISFPLNINLLISSPSPWMNQLSKRLVVELEPFIRSPNMYKKYLAEFWYSAKALENSKVSFSIPTGGIYGEVGENTFRNSTGAHYFPRSSEYVAPLSIDMEVKLDALIRSLTKMPLILLYSTNGINMTMADIVGRHHHQQTIKHREQVIHTTRYLFLLYHKIKEGYRDGELTLYPTQVFSVNNWALKPNQPEEPPFTDHMLPICTTDTPVVFKAPKTFSKAKSVSQGTKLGAKYGHKKLSTSSKQSFVSNREPTSSGSSKAPTSSKTGHSKNEKSLLVHGPQTQSPASISTNVGVLNAKEDQNDASATSTAEIDPGKSAPSDFVPPIIEEALTCKQAGRSRKAVLKVQPSLQRPGSSPDVDLSIVVEDSDEDERCSHYYEYALRSKIPSPRSFLNFKSSPPSPYSFSIKSKTRNIRRTKLKLKLLSLHSKPSFPIMKQLRELLKQVHELEIELPGDLKEIPTKLDDFTKTVTSLTSQVAELKTLHGNLSTEFLSLPAQFTVQTKLKTLDALPSLLLNVTKALNKFAQVLDSASSKAGDQSVPSAGQADTMPTKGEKNINQATISHLFQRRAEKNAERKNLNKPQPEMTPPPIPPIITTTTHMQSPFLSNPPESSSQPEGEKTKIDKGKKAMSLKDAEEESTESDSDDETTHLPGSMVESSKKKD